MRKMKRRSGRKRRGHMERFRGFRRSFFSSLFFFTKRTGMDKKTSHSLCVVVVVVIVVVVGVDFVGNLSHIHIDVDTRVGNGGKENLPP